VKRRPFLWTGKLSWCSRGWAGWGRLSLSFISQENSVTCERTTMLSRSPQVSITFISGFRPLSSLTPAQLNVSKPISCDMSDPTPSTLGLLSNGLLRSWPSPRGKKNPACLFTRGKFHGSSYTTIVIIKLWNSPPSCHDATLAVLLSPHGSSRFEISNHTTLSN
jgi:hypothetical protein